MKKIICIIILGFCFFSSHSQSYAFSVDLGTVDIVEEKDIKVIKVGFHNVFSITSKVLSLYQQKEIASFISPSDSNLYLIKSGFIKVDFEKKINREIPVIIRLRKVLDSGLPGDVAYVDTINVNDYLERGTLKINFKRNNILLDSSGIFITIEAIKERDKNILGVEMTTKSKDVYTYTKRNDTNEWDKMPVFPNEKTWNAKVGFHLIVIK